MPILFVKALMFLVGLSVFLAMGLEPWIAGGTMVVLTVTLAITAFVAWGSMHLPAQPSLESVDLESPEVPEVVRAEWTSVDRKLSTLGYRRYSASRVQRPLGLFTLSAAWLDAAGEVVLSVAVPVRAGRAVTAPIHTASTWLRDGRAIETTTLPDRLGWPIEGLAIGLFPMIRNLETLLAMHSRRVAELAPGITSADVVPRTDPLEDTVTAYRRSCESAIANRYLRPADGSAGYAPTLRGFTRMTLVNFWPVVRILRIVERRRAHADLSEFGFIDHASGGVSRWVVGLASLAVLIPAMGASLGPAALGWLGMAAIVYVQQRRARGVGPGTILCGGGLGILALLGILIAQGEWPLLIGTTLYILPHGMYVDLREPALFVLGAAGLFWGWSGILYLYPIPAKPGSSS